MRRCAKCGKRVSKHILVCDKCWGIKTHIYPRRGSKADKAAWKISLFLLLPILIGSIIWRSCEQERKNSYRDRGIHSPSISRSRLR